MNVTSTVSLDPEVHLDANALMQESVDLIEKEMYSKAIQTLAPVVKAMALDEPKPFEINALVAMATAQHLNQQPEDAYKNLVVASELSPATSNEILPLLFASLAKIDTPLKSPTFERHLIEYFSDKALDNSAVEHLAVKVIIDRYDLKNDDAKIDFATLISDVFLTAAIGDLELADPMVRAFIMQIRTQVFTIAIEHNLPDEIEAIVIALARFAERLEYKLPISPSESVILLGIQTLLETDVKDQSDLEANLGSLLIYAMYQPIHDLPISSIVASSSWEALPSGIGILMKRVFLNKNNESA